MNSKVLWDNCWVSGSIKTYISTFDDYLHPPTPKDKLCESRTPVLRVSLVKNKCSNSICWIDFANLYLLHKSIQSAADLTLQLASEYLYLHVPLYLKLNTPRAKCIILPPKLFSLYSSDGYHCHLVTMC